MVDGQFPQCLGNLVNLIQLSFVNTLIVGDLPVSICQMQKLERLAMFLVDIGGNIPECIGNMTALTGMHHLSYIPVSPLFIVPNICFYRIQQIGGYRSSLHL